jgi:hypothetical protein
MTTPEIHTFDVPTGPGITTTHIWPDPNIRTTTVTVGGEAAASTLRRFQLVRDVDATGVSGTGVVVEGVRFTDGTVALRWLSEHTSTAIYASIDDVEKIHGHDGATRVVWLDWLNPPPAEAWSPGAIARSMYESMRTGRYATTTPWEEIDPQHRVAWTDAAARAFRLVAQMSPEPPDPPAPWDGTEPERIPDQEAYRDHNGNIWVAMGGGGAGPRRLYLAGWPDGIDVELAELDRMTHLTEPTDGAA